MQDIYEIADKLELSFRKMVKNYLPQLKVTTVTSTPSQALIEPPFEVVYMPFRDNTKNLEARKKSFLEKVSALTEEGLEKVIFEIQKVAPNCFKEFDREWAKIDLQSL